MKGATATKVILETLFAEALFEAADKLGKRPHPALMMIRGGKTSSGIEKTFTRFADARSRMVGLSSGLGPVLEMAGNALNSRGHIYYCGEGIAGKWGIVDASECPPTFGADFHDVRGFMPGGWAQFCSSCADHSHVEHLYDIDVENFTRSIIPGLKPDDLVVFTGSRRFYQDAREVIDRCSGANVFYILIRPGRQSPDPEGRHFDLVIDRADDWRFNPVFTSTIIKLIYNAVTTAAHIFKGKVYQNKMIDLRISNNKLFFRAIRIIGELMGVDDKDAADALLRSIYGTDDLEPSIRNAPVSAHIIEGTGQDRIVPVALLIATGRFNVERARERVEREHIIRNIIRNEPESS
jgi:hypothetical protein